MEPMRNDSKPEIKKEVVQAEIKETNQEHEKNESIFAKTKIKKSPEKGIFCNEFSMRMCYPVHCKCTVTPV